MPEYPISSQTFLNEILIALCFQFAADLATDPSSCPTPSTSLLTEGMILRTSSFVSTFNGRD